MSKSKYDMPDPFPEIVAKQKAQYNTPSVLLELVRKANPDAAAVVDAGGSIDLVIPVMPDPSPPLIEPIE